jgi:hypothetical protein
MISMTKLRAGNNCYNSDQNIIHSGILSKNQYIKIIPNRKSPNNMNLLAFPINGNVILAICPHEITLIPLEFTANP